MREERKTNGVPGRAWVKDWDGAFKNDPLFEEALRLGRQYRKTEGARFPKRKRR
jgi:hypothetical protein